LGHGTRTDILYDCPPGYKSLPTPSPAHLPKQLTVTGTYTAYIFPSYSSASPDCLSSHCFIPPRIRHDYAKPYM